MTRHFTIFFCVIVFALVWLGLRPDRADAQSSETTAPRFEVSSVKQNRSESDESKISDSIPDRFVATNVPVRFLILYAYKLLDNQLVGAPDWTFDKPFDVIGTYPGGRRSPVREVRLMLQNLLADRFDLRVHHEERELPAYDLVVAKKDGRLGPQMRVSDMNCAARTAENHPKTTARSPNPVQTLGERPVCATIATRKSLTGGARTMQDLAASLQSMLRRPVVDRTGLTASYDIDLQWAPMDLHADEAATAASNEGPSLFTALQDQLGLKLVSHKEKFDVFVVDEIEPPSPN